MERFSSDVWLAEMDLRIKPWVEQKTFDNEREAKQYAAKMFVLSTGVMVAPYAGGTFTVFSWVKNNQ